MKYELQESEETRGGFVVTAIEHDGEVHSVLFTGPRAKERAEEYVKWKNSELDTPQVAPQSR